jgi:hypothetical protein
VKGPGTEYQIVPLVELQQVIRWGGIMQWKIVQSFIVHDSTKFSSTMMNGPEAPPRNVLISRMKVCLSFLFRLSGVDERSRLRKSFGADYSPDIGLETLLGIFPSPTANATCHPHGTLWFSRRRTAPPLANTVQL